MPLNKRFGQSTIEYVMIIGLVIVALSAMMAIFSRLNSGRLQQIQDYVTERRE